MPPKISTESTSLEPKNNTRSVTTGMSGSGTLIALTTLIAMGLLTSRLNETLQNEHTPGKTNPNAISEVIPEEVETKFRQEKEIDTLQKEIVRLRGLLVLAVSEKPQPATDPSWWAPIGTPEFDRAVKKRVNPDGTIKMDDIKPVKGKEPDLLEL